MASSVDQDSSFLEASLHGGTLLSMMSSIAFIFATSQRLAPNTFMRDTPCSFQKGYPVQMRFSNCFPAAPAALAAAARWGFQTLYACIIPNLIVPKFATGTQSSAVFDFLRPIIPQALRLSCERANRNTPRLVTRRSRPCYLHDSQAYQKELRPNPWFQV